MQVPSFSAKVTRRLATVGIIVIVVLLLDCAYEFAYRRRHPTNYMHNGTRPWSTGNNVMMWVLFVVYAMLFLGMSVTIFKMYT